MRHTTFRQFEVFEAIARLGSFTRAAEELHLTQPTVSMQIKKLTDAVGLPLFEQLGKRIHLTDAGHALFATCREISEQLSRFEMTVSDMKGLKKGRLRLAVVSTAKYFAPRLLGQFCQHYPGIEVALKVTNRQRVLERLLDNQDDLYITGQPPEELDVECHAVPGKSTGGARSDRSPPRRQEADSAQTAGRRTLFDARSGLRHAPGNRAATSANTASRPISGWSSAATKRSSRPSPAGLGVSVLSRHTLALDAATSQIAILDVVHFPIKRHWYVLWPKGKQLSVVARTFLGHLQNAGTNITELPRDPRKSASARPSRAKSAKAVR